MEHSFIIVVVKKSGYGSSKRKLKAGVHRVRP